MLLADDYAAGAQTREEMRHQCAVDVPHPDDQVEIAGGQRALGIVVEIRLQPLDVEPALCSVTAPALERHGGNVERADGETVCGEEQRVASGAASDVERAAARDARQPLRQQRARMRAVFVSAVTITCIPLVAFGGAHVVRDE